MRLRLMQKLDLVIQVARISIKNVTLVTGFGKYISREFIMLEVKVTIQHLLRP